MSPGDDRCLEKDAGGCETTVCPPGPARLSMGNSKMAFVSVLGSPHGPGTQLWPTEAEGHLQANPPNLPGCSRIPFLFYQLETAGAKTLRDMVEPQDDRSPRPECL